MKDIMHAKLSSKKISPIKQQSSTNEIYSEIVGSSTFLKPRDKPVDPGLQVSTKTRIKSKSPIPHTNSFTSRNI